MNVKEENLKITQILNFKTMSNKNKKVDKVEELLNKANKVDNAVLKSALNKRAEQVKEEEERNLIYKFQDGEYEIKNWVELLRKARKIESSIKKVIEDLNSAFEEFQKDGDIEKFDKALKGNNNISKYNLESALENCINSTGLLQKCRKN